MWVGVLGGRQRIRPDNTQVTHFTEWTYAPPIWQKPRSDTVLRNTLHSAPSEGQRKWLDTLISKTSC